MQNVYQCPKNSYSMKLFLSFLLILILGIVTLGYAEPVTEQSFHLTSDPVAGSVLATLSNDQPKANFMQDAGAVLVSFQADGPQTLTFNQKCTKDWADFTELKISAPYNGTLTFNTPVTDECTLNISGTGIWTAQVTKFVLDNPLKVPLNLSGQGTMVTAPFTLEQGQYIFQREETGKASPLYQITYANGSPLMDVNNTHVIPDFGMLSPEFFKIIDIPESGTYYLSVFSTKEDPTPWHASILTIPEPPQMGPGPAILQKA
jgi:hypothetical protein